MGLLAVLIIAGGTLAYVVQPTVHAGTTGESPELGRSGAFEIGTVETRYLLRNRSRITGWGAVTGSLATGDHELAVRFWYPSDAVSARTPTRYTHELTAGGQQPILVTSEGFAVEQAAALPGRQFPLVLLSHGYGGWNTQFSNLAEHIASHGYVVASIEHRDTPADGITATLLSFANVLVDRTLDQRQILAQIIAGAKAKKTPYLAQIDPANIGLIGYSMGGYGAIATAGAAYEFKSQLMSKLPDASQTQLRTAAETPAPIKALVTFAPWGGQPDNRAWNSQTLANIRVPVMLISGNQDDVVNFKSGVTWLYDNMIGTERYMLVFREARHNIVGNDFVLGKNERSAAYEFLKEPVWRSDRLNAINQHFVTAFLDLTLKGDLAKRAYLAVPIVDSNAGDWPISFGEQLNGTTAGSEQVNYWRGFQRRWAVGLEMHRKVPASTASTGRK